MESMYPAQKNLKITKLSLILLRNPTKEIEKARTAGVQRAAALCLGPGAAFPLG